MIRALAVGLAVATMLWSDGQGVIPCDYRLFDRPVNHLTKNDHFQALLKTAKQRGFQPRYVAVDSWYSSLANLKTIRKHDWHWFTRLKSNRHVNPDGTGNRALWECVIRETGTGVHLKGYGFILVFRIDTPDSYTEYWATSDLTLTLDERETPAGQIWAIETYYRGLKQFCGVERCTCHKAIVQRNHIDWAIRAFLRLEHHRITTGRNWFESKLDIIRPAIQQFLAGRKELLRGFEQATLAHKCATA